MGNTYKKSLEKIVEELRIVDQYIKKEKPNLIVVPLRGAAPFIDILNIIDDEFPNEIVEYIIASSCVKKVREIIKKSLFSLIVDKLFDGGKIVFIDEVVSGNSLVRIYKQFHAALNEYAERKIISIYGKDVDMTRENIQNYKESLIKKFEERHIGLVEKKKVNKNKEYLELVNEGIVIPFYVQRIPTRDQPKYRIIHYREKPLEEDRIRYLPEIEKVEASQEYLELLKDVAMIIGKDPESVKINNIEKILNANEWPKLYDELKESV